MHVSYTIYLIIFKIELSQPVETKQLPDLVYLINQNMLSIQSNPSKSISFLFNHQTQLIRLWIC